MSETQKLISVDLEDVEFLQAICRERGVEYRPEPSRGDPITLIVFLVLGTAVAVTAVQDAIDRHKGGQVIDLRADAERPFYRSKDLAYGLLYLRTRDGQVSLQAMPGTSSLDQLTKTVLAMRANLLDLTKEEAIKEIASSIDGGDLVVGQG